MTSKMSILSVSSDLSAHTRGWHVTSEHRILGLVASFCHWPSRAVHIDSVLQGFVGNLKKIICQRHAMFVVICTHINEQDIYIFYSGVENQKKATYYPVFYNTYKISQKFSVSILIPQQGRKKMLFLVPRSFPAASNIQLDPSSHHERFWLFKVPIGKSARLAAFSSSRS